MKVPAQLGVYNKEYSMLRRLTQKIANALASALASRWFFYAIVGFFVFQALWIVFSAAYPMAFDEDFHFGIIQIYSHQWSPLLHQPSDADAYGAITRDPSYLYHYLLSFPLRFARLFTDNQVTQILVLRGINVGLFVLGIVLARRLLLKLKTSPAATHGALFLFCLIPIVPLLAAHINYDNVVMALVPALLLAAVRFVQNLRQRSFDVAAFLGIGILCAVGGIVKYAFLPVAVAVAGFTLFYLIKTYVGKQKTRHFANEWKAAWLATPRFLLALLVAGLIVSAGLFFERYAINAVVYKTPLPACERVIGEERCSEYPPWQRNYVLKITKTEPVDQNALEYTFSQWLWGLGYRLFFMVAGPSNNFDTRQPLPVVYRTGVVLAVVSIGVCLLHARRLVKNPFFVLIMVTSFSYLAALWLSNYSDFKETSQPVAVNGRYLIPLLLPVAAVALQGFSYVFRRFWRAKLPVFVVVAFLFLQGGGVVSFIVSSRPAWDWQNDTVVRVNGAARSLLKPLIIEGDTQDRTPPS